MNLETRMFREAAAAPAAVHSQLRDNRALIEDLGGLIRRWGPRAVVTCARGSSDHAATYARYLIETRTGLLTSSASPSISSVYASKPRLEGVLFLAISQSGASPDLLAAVAAARMANAHVIAIVNEVESALGRAAHHTIPLRAGAETSVAATKSYIATLAAVAQLVANWSQDDELRQALELAPDLLRRAWQLDWSAAVAHLQTAPDLYVVGRGLGLGVAQEAALKLKETCGLHAEAFSAAELRHGPMTLVREGFPVLAFAQDDQTRKGVAALARELHRLGADVLLAGAGVPGVLVLPTQRAHAAIEPLLMIQSFYRLANALAIARGRDPDRPPHLHKITETV